MVRLIGAFFVAVRLVTPWVIRATGFTVMLVLTAVASLWTGIPNAVEVIGRQWEDQAYQSGLPTLYLPYVYHGARAVAMLTILAGWVVFAHITVLLLSVIL